MKTETASFALGYQAVKGTGAANYVKGIFSSHRNLPAYNILRAENEHRGIHERPSIHQTTAIRGDVIVPWSAAFLARPYLIGYALLMTGYKVSTVADSPVVGAYTHTFTEADADEIGYGSLLEYLGEGTARYGMRAVDAKASTLNFNATRGGIAVDMGGFAITPGDAIGTEVQTAEKDILFHPGTGSFTLTSATVTAMGTPRSHKWSIINNLDDQEQELHSIYRAALTESGRSRTGTMGGLVFSEDVFRQIAYEGGAAPTIMIPECSLTWSYQSPGAFVGTTKYSLTWTYANCELEMTAFDVSGATRMLYEANYTARDSVAGSPSTVVLVNDLASYAGS